MTYKGLAKSILKGVGGMGNILSYTYCSTRIRFFLKDVDRAETEYLKEVRGIKGVVLSNGQYMVVIGKGVENVYEELKNITDNIEEKDIYIDEKEKVSIINLFIYFLSAIGILAIVLDILNTFDIIYFDNRIIKTIQSIGLIGLYIIPFAVLKSLKVKKDEVIDDVEIIYGAIKGSISRVANESIKIFPENNLVVSAVDGIVKDINKINNSITILSDKGTEILIIIGENISDEMSKYFKGFVKEGERIRIGEPLIEFELNGLEISGAKKSVSLSILNKFHSIKQLCDFSEEQKPLFELS